MRVNHTCRRRGALAYLAAYDVALTVFGTLTIAPTAALKI